MLAGWLAALGLLVGVSGQVGPAYSTRFDMPGTDSTRAVKLLRAHFPTRAGDTDLLVLRTRTGTVRDSAVRRAASLLLAEVAASPHVDAVASPYTSPGQISADGRTAFAVVHFDALSPDPTAVRHVIDLGTRARSHDLQVNLSGDAVGSVQRTKPGPYEALGLGVAAVVLFLAFGSLLAAVLPLLTAGVALGIALSAIALLSHLVALADFAPGLATLLGLGAGIDYALFVVSRTRRELLGGAGPVDAIGRAAATSGRAVLFAGGTVCAAVLGMLALGVDLLSGIAVAAALAVALTMASALTLLPALLGFLGNRVLSRRERRQLATSGPHGQELSTRWLAWARSVQRHPWLALLGAVAVVAVLAAPLASLRFGNSDQGNDPAGSTTRTAYDQLANAFGPGFNAPLLVAVDASNPAARTITVRLRTELVRQPGVAAVTPIDFSADGAAATLTVYPSTRPQDAATAALLRRIRDETIPATVGDSGVAVHVGGTTAAFADFTRILTSKMPLFIAVILTVSFLLLMLVFRSLLVPLKAGLLNLTSIAAAFGAVVAVFQWGWGASLIGIEPGPVEAFLPVMLFAILFGLSMDYEVFLVTRIHEEWMRTHDNARAVTAGLAATGRLITAAAAIMVAIFASFMLGGERVIKLFGFGFAVAVFLDAVLIRSVLVPAVMQLAGRANWWLPQWLDRLLPDTRETSTTHAVLKRSMDVASADKVQLT